MGEGGGDGVVAFGVEGGVEGEACGGGGLGEAVFGSDAVGDVVDGGVDGADVVGDFAEVGGDGGEGGCGLGGGGGGEAGIGGGVHGEGDFVARKRGGIGQALDAGDVEAVEVGELFAEGAVDAGGGFPLVESWAAGEDGGAGVGEGRCGRVGGVGEVLGEDLEEARRRRAGVGLDAGEFGVVEAGEGGVGGDGAGEFGGAGPGVGGLIAGGGDAGEAGFPLGQEGLVGFDLVGELGLELEEVILGGLVLEEGVLEGVEGGEVGVLVADLVVPVGEAAVEGGLEEVGVGVDLVLFAGVGGGAGGGPGVAAGGAVDPVEGSLKGGIVGGGELVVVAAERVKRSMGSRLMGSPSAGRGCLRSPSSMRMSWTRVAVASSFQLSAVVLASLARETLTRGSMTVCSKRVP